MAKAVTKAYKYYATVVLVVSLFFTFADQNLLVRLIVICQLQTEPKPFPVIKKL